MSARACVHYGTGRRPQTAAAQHVVRNNYLVQLSKINASWQETVETAQIGAPV